MNGNAGWYAIRVRARAEQLTFAALTAKQVSCFLPCWEEKRVYSDRVRCQEVAAFPGYLFCHTDLSERTRILSTPGVQQLVGARAPERIDDDVIRSLQMVFSRVARASLVPYLNTGDRVRILEGPMTGATGILLRSKAEQRLVISVHILQRSVAVEVDGASVTLLRSESRKEEVLV